MFNSKEIILEVVGAMLRHLQTQLGELYFGGAEIQPLIPVSHWQIAPYEQSPIAEQIALLVQVANGEYAPASESDASIVGEIAETIQNLCETLFVTPFGANSYEIPASFWNTPLGQVVMHCQLWLRSDELISLSEAAHLLRGSAEGRHLVYINDLIKRGKLTRYSDPHEANPQRAGRVSRAEVEALK